MAISPGTSIAVVGPGAIGSTVAALLHAAGHRVVVCGRTARDSIELRPDDGVILAVKDTQNEAAAAWLDRLCDANTLACVMQNGVEQVERVGRYCPAGTVVPCAVWFSAQSEPDASRRCCVVRRLARRRDRRDHWPIHWRARGSDHLNPDRPGARQAAGMGRPQRGHRTQGGRARPGLPISDLVVPLLAAASDGPG